MKKFVRVFLVIIFLILLISPIIFFYKSKLKIYCKSEYYECSQNINEIINSENKNIFSLFYIYKKVRSLDNVKNTKLRFSNNGFIIFVTENKSVVAFFKNENYELVDIDGNINSILVASALPTIFDKTKSLKISERKYIANLVLVLSKTHELILVEVDDTKLVVVTNMLTAYFPKEGNLKRDIGAFELVYSWLNKSDSQARIEKKSENTIIDFRTKNPVLIN